MNRNTGPLARTFSAASNGGRVSGILCAVALLAGSGLSAPASAAPSRLAADYGKLPIRFEPNVGQTPAPVKFVARGPGYGVGLTEQGALIDLRRDGSTAPARLRLGLAGAAPAPELVAERQQASVSNYFYGNDPARWHSHVPNYGAVRYRQIYPGIDWVVYGNPRQLEYDLVVAAQADPRRIRLKVDGADRLALDADGALLIQAGQQTLRQPSPVVYQDTTGGRRYIAAHYLLRHRQVALALGAYDHGRELVIDPTLAYSTYLGGSGDEEITGMAVDSAGNAYITGLTNSPNFPTVDAEQASGSSDDAFVAKLDPSGSTLIYSTYLGGSSIDYGFAIAVDNSGAAYVAGYTTSADFPTVNPVQAKFGGNTDAFVSKLNAAGDTLVYSTYLGGGDSEIASAIAVDSSGAAYVGGTTDSADFPTASPLQPTIGGGSDAFVAKLKPAGNALVYSTYLGGSFGETANGLAIDSSGDAYVVGLTNSGDFPTANPMQAAAHGDGDAFVAKLNPAGSALVYSTYLGGSAGEQATAVTVDGSGAAYVVGETQSTDFPMVSPWQDVNRGGSDAFLAKLDAGGDALVYSSYYGGTGDDQANAVAVDSAGNIYLAGETTSSGLQLNNPILANNTGNTDAFVVVFNPTISAQLFGTLLSGSQTDIANAVAVDGGGNIYVAGSTASSDFLTAAPLQGANAGSVDAFIAKIGLSSSPPPAPTVTISANPASITLGQATTLSWSSTNVTGCVASGGWSGNEAVSGSLAQTPSSAGTVSYILTCTGVAGSATGTAKVTVTAPAPTVTIGASPASITLGQTTSLNWSSTNATSCTASGGWSGNPGLSGAVVETPSVAGTISYTLSCSGTGGTATGSAQVKVSPSGPTATGLSGKAGGGGFGLDSLCGLALLLALRHLRGRRMGLGLMLLFCGLPAFAQQGEADNGLNFALGHPYAGIRGGIAVYTTNPVQAGDAETVTDLERHRAAGVIYAGLPFLNDSLAVEVGFADLGVYHLGLSTTSSDVSRVAHDTLRRLSPAGRGATLGLGGAFDLGRWVAVEPRLGMLVYRSRQELSSATASYERGGYGVGMDAGAALLFHPLRSLYVGAGFDCFHTNNGCDVALTSAQLEFHFGR